jgi:hypothetical protein
MSVGQLADKILERHSGVVVFSFSSAAALITTRVTNNVSPLTGREFDRIEIEFSESDD